jgi:hypothetical protein
MPVVDNPRLILTPKQKDFRIEAMEFLLNALTQAGFIGDELEQTNDFKCYEYGEDYLHLISYLGCSPAVTSTNSAGDTESFISIRQFETIQFAYSSAVPPPRCPHCQKTDKNWPQYWHNWQLDLTATQQCIHCEQHFNFAEMKWKKNGGTGSLLIQVHGIQEHLAVPSPALMSMLEQATGTSWHYFFAA